MKQIEVDNLISTSYVKVAMDKSRQLPVVQFVYSLFIVINSGMRKCTYVITYAHIAHSASAREINRIMHVHVYDLVWLSVQCHNFDLWQQDLMYGKLPDSLTTVSASRSLEKQGKTGKVWHKPIGSSLPYYLW